MGYIKRDDNKATDMMWDAALGGGGPWVHCGCGIDHSMTDEEFVDGGYNGFRYSNLNEIAFVQGCSGCEERLGKYERFIWDNRDAIRRYLKIRIDQEKAWADQEHLLNTLAGI